MMSLSSASLKPPPDRGPGASAKSTHYHYDLEGRLIAETDGTSGETLREYVWLGLMPIAVIAQTESEPEGECNPVLIEVLEAELTASTAAATALQTQIIEWDGNIEFREAKIAQMRAQLEGLSGKKREKLEAKIAKWESLITSTEARLVEAEAELAAVNAQITDIEEALTTEQAICAGTVTGTQAGIFYLHADHLGRPQFATDEAGTTVWDMGGEVTPFGEGVNMAGAFAQKLMFPGQYADEETGEDVTLSHNWHRTYDPTLGRYLQSDPIGLAGGFNRYAYVGGNPVGWIDPSGLTSSVSFPPGAAFAEANRMARGAVLKPRARTPWGAAWAFGTVLGVYGGALYYELMNEAGDDCEGDNVIPFPVVKPETEVIPAPNESEFCNFAGNNVNFFSRPSWGNRRCNYVCPSDFAKGFIDSPNKYTCRPIVPRHALRFDDGSRR